jgi:hypothetical protein
MIAVPVIIYYQNIPGHRASKKHIYDESHNTKYCFEMQVHDKKAPQISHGEVYELSADLETDDVPIGIN